MMRERERARERDNYEDVVKYLMGERERSYRGEVVIRGKERPFTQSRQAIQRFYLWPSRYSGDVQTAANDDWNVFVQDIKEQSGQHRHQGGLVIYIVEGEGYSVVEGERHDWVAGDLLLLPFKPGGIEHQHFNKYEGQSTRWVAFISAQIMDWGASEMIQLKEHPSWTQVPKRTNGRAQRA
jgi:hypothetical protein